jgi:hypothetical protein
VEFAFGASSLIVVYICVLCVLVELDLIVFLYRMCYMLAIDGYFGRGQRRAAGTGSCSGFVPLVLLQAVGSS